MANHAVSSQVRFVVRSMKSKIAAAIKAKLEEIAELNYVSFDRVKLRASDFNDYDVPAVQVIDLEASYQPEQNRSLVEWMFAIEIILKQTSSHVISQEDLWNLEYVIVRKLMSAPNLNIPGVIHMKPQKSETDLHLIEPFYLSRLLFSVSFYETAVRDC